MRRRPKLAIVVGSLVLATIIWSPAFFDVEATGPGDWQMIHHNWEAAWVALTRHGEWPLWDPYHCGGVPILGNPESQALSPLTLLSIPFRPTLAIKLFVLLHAWAGFVGMAFLARRHYGLGLVGAAVAAVAWAGSGFFAWQVSEGHGTFVPYYLAPWLILSFRASIDDVRYAIPLALLMALVIFEGGTYPFPHFVLLLLFEGAVALVRSPNRLAVLRSGAIAATLGGLLASVRVLPIRAVMSELPRDVESTDLLTLTELLDMYTARRHAANFGHPYRWHEYGTYVGWAVLVCALLGVVPALRKKKLHLIGGALVFGVLLMGNFAPYAPWTLLHQLPVYDSLRVPTRMTVLLCLYVSLLAGIGLEAARDRLARLSRPRWLPRAVRALAVIVALGITVDVIATNFYITDCYDWAPVLDEEPVPDFLLVRAGSYHHQYASFPRRGVGTPACYPWGMRWHVARGLEVGLVPQARVRGRGSARDFSRTNNRMTVEVELEEDARVVFNQNYYAGWVANVGTVVDERGKLGLDVPAGTHSLSLHYEPPRMKEGLLLSGLGVLGCGGLFFWQRRRRRTVTAAP